MKEALHLSSMAYQDVEDYSKITHKHDYSKVKVYPYINDPELRSVGNISVDGKPYEIRVPDLPEISYDGPQIGEIKMIWAQTFGHLQFVGLYTDVEDRKFNGWVPCDGKEYKKSDFPEAFEYFRTQYDTETFHVPLLSNFFCGNYGNETEDQLKEFPEQIGIGEHSHNGISDFNAGESLELCATVSIPTTRSAGKEPYCHSGGGKQTGYLTEFVCDIDITGNKKIQYTGGQSDYTKTDDEPHPTYNDIPVLVYIGEKKYAT